MKIEAANVNQIQFWNRIRYLVVICVVVHHGACAYTKFVPWWYANTGETAPVFDWSVATFDLFIMPVLFFVSGYFALPSLRRHGAVGFLRGKIKRLLIPLIFLTIFYVPIINYIRSLAWGRNTSGSFFDYWTNLVLSFTPVCWRVFDSSESSLPYVDDMAPNYLWYLSLLFLFMLLFLVLELLLGRGGRGEATRERQRGRTQLFVLAGSGGLIALGMACVNMFIPFGTWTQASSFLVFQPIRIPLYAGLFFLGVYVNRHGWLIRRTLPGALWIWIVVMLLSEMTFMYCILHPQLFSWEFGRGLMIGTTRTAFALSMTVALTTIGFRYWQKSSWMHTLLAKSSYDLYLLHLPLLVALQYGLRTIKMSVYLEFSLAVASTLVVCIAASRITMKWPSWLRGVAMLVVFEIVCLAN